MRSKLEMWRRAVAGVSLTLLAAACGGGGSPTAGGRPDGGSGRGAAGPLEGNGAEAAVPVRTEPLVRGSISDAIRATGTLEAEEEVDLVARGSGTVTEILVEEGDRVRQGRLLARLDDREARNLVAQRTVTLEEARLAYGRAQTQRERGLVSQEAHDTAASALAAAEAQLEAARIQLADTEVRTPYDAVVSVRYVNRNQYVSPGTALFRIFADDPLLCRVQVPEKELTRLGVGQAARLEVGAFAERPFIGTVERIRPSVEAGTGTVTVTVAVRSSGVLRPGMFAAVSVETDRLDGVLVVPREALVLDAIGDVVFVVEDGVARRREVELGVRSDDVVQVVAGLAAGEPLVVLGQDGLADGTPVTELGAESPAATAAAGPDPAMLEQIRARMRERGLSEVEIEGRLARFAEGGGAGGRQGAGGGQAGPPAGVGGGDEVALPPFVLERIRQADDAELDRIRTRMRERGMSDEQVEVAIRSARGEDE